MRGILSDLPEFLLDLDPEEVLGGIILGLILGVLASGLERILRPRIADRTVVLSVVTLLTSVLAMAIAFGYARHAAEREEQEDGPFNGFIFDGVPASGPRGPWGPGPRGPARAYGPMPAQPPGTAMFGPGRLPLPAPPVSPKAGP